MYRGQISQGDASVQQLEVVNNLIMDETQESQLDFSRRA